MNPQEAHQIANPEILEILEDLEEWEADNWAIEYIHPFLKGILIAQEKELNFLNEISKWHEEFSVAYIKMVDKRREALKISCKDLRRVLK